MRLSTTEKKIISSIIDKIGANKNQKILIASFPALYKLLSKEEVAFCKRFLKLNPRDFGFRGAYLGIKPPAQGIKTIKGQAYTFKKKKIKIAPQYAPSPVYAAFKKLQRELKKATGKTILVESGYRSPAYQLFTVLYHLRLYKWNLKKTLKRVAMPGYSEHGDINTALDFITTEGSPSEEDLFGFAKTPEYAWLLKHAGEFGFTLSYPKGNKMGIMFEPWHWRFVGVK
jgi:LAS superfamily LD-carboxypeptidase LdcB